ncbi:LysE family transporter [Microbaculum marinum]|uniref:LysE family transporter n=1 Tax=Microbaculum marinum TaxID=1764581 RepID=A0AAW9S2Q3_9HYPH
MGEYAGVLGPLAAVWLIGVLTPGPNFFVTMHMAARHGRAAALTTVAGIAVGLSFWALAGLLGIKVLFATVPLAALAVKLAGAAYLIWMGIRMWRSAGAVAVPGGISPTSAFRLGLLTNLANAKTAAFAASLFAVALPPHASPGLFAAAFFTIVAMSTLWYGFCGVVGSRGAVMRLYNRFQTWLMRVAGAVFVGFGVKLAIER